MKGSGRDGDLPAAADAAWQAYRAMVRSKDAHFAELARMKRKLDHGEPRTLAESARLGQLLADHDQRVRDFATLMRALAAADGTAHRTLVAAIAASGRTSADGAMP